MSTSDLANEAPAVASAPKYEQSTLDILSAMIAATNAITRAADEPALLAAIVESLSQLQYDLFLLNRFCDGARFTLEIVGTWRRGAPPPVPAGTRLTRASAPGIEKALLKAMSEVALIASFGDHVAAAMTRVRVGRAARRVPEPALLRTKAAPGQSASGACSPRPNTPR
ncbi:MAG TPA: hypothetical protein VM580_34895 [Labilithrix sp.]|jgi:hypothetical protein|nr:hypothetical protein [Labilithrix sp.]